MCLLGRNRQRINRNILECKYTILPGNYNLSHVLIETYWNVKPEAYIVHRTAMGINRNILECKGSSGNLCFQDLVMY